MKMIFLHPWIFFVQRRHFNPIFKLCSDLTNHFWIIADLSADDRGTFLILLREGTLKLLMWKSFYSGFKEIRKQDRGEDSSGRNCRWVFSAKHHGTLRDLHHLPQLIHQRRQLLLQSHDEAWGHRKGWFYQTPPTCRMQGSASCQQMF